jgi:hypothetical protein
MKIKINKTMSRQYTLAKIIGTILLLAALLSQTACSEGGSGSGGLLAGGGIGGTGISIGQISAFGSVIVNDVEFDTQDAEVIVNGEQVGDGDADVRNILGLGMVVRVEGRFQGEGSGTADRVVFNENVKGPVSAVEDLDTMIKKITMLGQSVIVDGATLFKGTDFDHVTAGNVLQISGWTDGYGVIQATYVALVAATDDIVTVRGVVAEVSSVQKTMRINQLRIDYENAALSGFPTDQTPVRGQMVFVTGTLDFKGFLVADEVRLVNDLEVEDADDVEIEGIVSQFASPQNFVLGTTTIRTDDATVFQGIDRGDIFVGCRLQVKGSLSQGLLLADEVIAKDKVIIEGTVADVDNGLAEILLRGLESLTIRSNDVAKIFGDADKLENIQAGQHVKILGYAAGSDRVQAIKVKVERSNNKVKLQGPVTFKNSPVVSLLGVNVNTSQIADDGFETAEDGLITRGEFFSAVEVGDTVNAAGNLVGDRVNWKSIEMIAE